jgi:hypothetical protein
MEEESSFFDRERDRLAREINAVRKSNHPGIYRLNFICRVLKSSYLPVMR